MATVKSQIKSL